jgi:hypothetical protein
MPHHEQPRNRRLIHTAELNRLNRMTVHRGLGKQEGRSDAALCIPHFVAQRGKIVLRHYAESVRSRRFRRGIPGEDAPKARGTSCPRTLRFPQEKKGARGAPCGVAVGWRLHRNSRYALRTTAPKSRTVFLNTSSPNSRFHVSGSR